MNTLSKRKVDARVPYHSYSPLSWNTGKNSVSRKLHKHTVWSSDHTLHALNSYFGKLK